MAREVGDDSATEQKVAFSRLDRGEVIECDSLVALLSGPCDEHRHEHPIHIEWKPKPLSSEGLTPGERIR